MEEDTDTCFPKGMPRLPAPALSVWAKSNMRDPSDPSHLQVWQHLEDTGAIAGYVWDRFLPRHVRDLITADCGSENDARILYVFLASVHDVGKCSPAFQCMVSSLSDRTRMAGLQVPHDLKDDAKGWKKRIQDIIENDRAVDVALFGRMFTDNANLNIVAATEVAHAISVHGVETESDYYTAVDDMKAVSGDEDSGAAMVGDIEFNSATFYRYANVDANRLNDTLADSKVSARAAAEFVRAFAMSIPTGKIHGFAQRALPNLIIVSLRDTQPVNLAAAFRVPVKPDYVEHATERLIAQEHAFDKAFDVTPIRTWVIRAEDAAKDADQLGKVVTLKEAVDDIETTVRVRLANEAEA